MSRTYPSLAERLPPPLHNVFTGPFAANQWRILVLQNGEWITWKAMDAKRLRDAVLEKDRKENPHLTFGSQNHRNTLDTP